ncbi:hypothetical protein SGPA1_31507 [Streptomyces misionensis JCM 4497]
MVRQPHRGRRLHQGRGRADRPRDREDVHHHARHHVPPGRARAAHAARQGGLPLHLRVQPAGDRTGGPRRERGVPAAHRARGGVRTHDHRHCEGPLPDPWQRRGDRAAPGPGRLGLPRHAGTDRGGRPPGVRA